MSDIKNNKNINLDFDPREKKIKSNDRKIKKLENQLDKIK